MADDDKTDVAAQQAEGDEAAELRFKRERVRVVIEMDAQLINGQLYLPPTAPSACRGCVSRQNVTRCREANMFCHVLRSVDGPFEVKPLPNKDPIQPAVPGRPVSRPIGRPLGGRLEGESEE